MGFFGRPFFVTFYHGPEPSQCLVISDVFANRCLYHRRDVKIDAVIRSLPPEKLSDKDRLPRVKVKHQNVNSRLGHEAELPISRPL